MRPNLALELKRQGGAKAQRSTKMIALNFSFIRIALLLKHDQGLSSLKPDRRSEQARGFLHILFDPSLRSYYILSFA